MQQDSRHDRQRDNDMENYRQSPSHPEVQKRQNHPCGDRYRGVRIFDERVSGHRKVYAADKNADEQLLQGESGHG